MATMSKDAESVLRGWAKDTCYTLDPALKRLHRSMLDRYFTGDGLPSPPWWWYPVQHTARGLGENLARLADGEPLPSFQEDVGGILHAEARTLKGLADRMPDDYARERRKLRSAAVDAAGIARRIAEGGDGS